VIARPVSGSKKYSRAGSTAKVTRPPVRTPARGSSRAMPLGALAARMPPSEDSSAAAAAAAAAAPPDAWTAGVASSWK
jgi:hypothetical protein